jgi:hypothetical protein
MISAFHLLWIIPIVFTFGFGVCAILTVSKDAR